MFEPIEITSDAVIKVLGVGGGGGNAVEHMVRECIEGVIFFAINTDAQALRKTTVDQTIQIGSNITKGLGAGANPEIGYNSAEEDREILRATLEGANMIFIAAGMGGGTGTGAAPVIAEIAKDMGILTIAVVTKPFSFEGKKRMAFAEQGIAALSKYVDSLIIIPNDKLLKVLKRDISLLDAFSTANNILKGAVQGISDLITRPGIMNVDFADIRTIMSEMGYAMMGSGIASGENRAKEAVEIAISSPLMEDLDLSGARGVLVNITSGFDLRLDEFETIGNSIRSFASDNAMIVIGTTLDPDIHNELRITVIATGIGVDKKSEVTLVANQYRKTSLNDYNYAHLMTMTPLKQNPNIMTHTSNNKNSKEHLQSDYLDIPAFLRKQAD